MVANRRRNLGRSGQTQTKINDKDWWRMFCDQCNSLSGDQFAPHFINCLNLWYPSRQGRRGQGMQLFLRYAACQSLRVSMRAACLLLPLDCDHFWVLFSHNEFWESMGIVNSILRLEPWKAKIRLFILVIGLSPKTFLVFIQLKAVTNPMQTKRGWM